MSESFEEIANSEDVSFDEGNWKTIAESRKYINYLCKLHKLNISYDKLAKMLYQSVQKNRRLVSIMSKVDKELSDLRNINLWESENRRWEAMKTDDREMGGL